MLYDDLKTKFLSCRAQLEEVHIPDIPEHRILQNKRDGLLMIAKDLNGFFKKSNVINRHGFGVMVFGGCCLVGSIGLLVFPLVVVSQGHGAIPPWEFYTGVSGMCAGFWTMVSGEEAREIQFRAEHFVWEMDAFMTTCHSTEGVVVGLADQLEARLEEPLVEHPAEHPAEHRVEQIDNLPAFEISEKGLPLLSYHIAMDVMDVKVREQKDEQEPGRYAVLNSPGIN